MGDGGDDDHPFSSHVWDISVQSVQRILPRPVGVVRQRVLHVIAPQNSQNLVAGHVHTEEEL